MKRTYSDEIPVIRRLQGVILYPHDVREETRLDEDGGDRTEYSYEILRVEDHGQQIEDAELFALENYAELRQVAIWAHWPQSRQNEAVMENAEGRPDLLQEYVAWKSALDAAFPKP